MSETIAKLSRRWWQEPLLWFLLLGVLLFWFNALTDGGDEETEVLITPNVKARITDQWQAQMGREPTAEEVQGLLNQWIREEIYFREALRLGLDSQDTIVRRRMVQKLTFLTEDVATAIEPTEAEVADYYAANVASYVQAPVISFEHRYFSADRRKTAEADASAALAGLTQLATSAEAPQLGDPFMLQLNYVQRTQRQVADLFGRDFAKGLFGVPISSPTNSWQGPIRSAYGWHLVRVTHTAAEVQQPLVQVQDRVTADLLLDKRERANENYYQNLRQRYAIQEIE